MELLVGPREAGKRLDVLVAGLPSVSRRRARRLIERGAVWVDGRRVRIAGRRIRQGHRVVVFLGEEEAEEPDLRSRILLLDEQFVAVDKPAGLPAAATPSDTLRVVPALLARQLGWSREPLPLHRLDRDTTGVMVLARSRDVADRVAECLAAGMVQRHYLAIAQGEPSEAEGTWDWPLERDPRRTGRWRIAPSGRGKKAVTRFRVLGPVEHLPGAWVLALALVTGRTHQVRLHMARAGLPVLGDLWYGVRRGLTRMFLHSHRWALFCGQMRISVESVPAWWEEFNLTPVDTVELFGGPPEFSGSRRRCDRGT